VDYVDDRDLIFFGGGGFSPKNFQTFNLNLVHALYCIHIPMYTIVLYNISNNCLVRTQEHRYGVGELSRILGGPLLSQLMCITWYIV